MLLLRTKHTFEVNRFIIFSLILALSIVLTGCGGGGSDPGNTASGGDTADTAILLNYPVNFPRNDSMPFSAGRYYTITGLNPGYQYQLTLASTDPLWLFSTDIGCYITMSCLFTAPDSGEFTVQVAFNAEDPNGANYTLNVQLMTHEGTFDAPNDLTGLLPYSGTVIEDIKNYYVIHGLTPGNSYNITDDGVVVRIYQDQFASSGFSNIDSFSDPLSFTAASDTVWVRVYDSYSDGPFTLTLTDNGLPNPGYLSEGTATVPIELTLDTLYQGQTDDSGSYYHISGLVPDKEYGIGLDKHSGDTTPLLVYNEDGYGIEACKDDVKYVGENLYDCAVAASASGELWIKQEVASTGRLLGASYSLMVYTYFPDEGSNVLGDKLLNFSTDMPSYNGTVDKTSYYTLDGLESNVTYITTITGYDSSANLSFNVAKAYNWVAGCYSVEPIVGTKSCSLVSHPDNGTLAFEVTESNDYKGTPFTLDVERSLYQSEGAVTAPVVLSFDTTNFPYSGEVGAVDSYYEISGVTAGQAYTVTISGLLDVRDIYVYDDFANLGSTSSLDYACYDSGTAPSCTVRATSTTIWLRVRHDDHTPAGFTIDATLSPYQAEGTIGSPVAMSFGVSYGGMVDVTQSYYILTGLTPNETYLITATGVSSDGTPRLYVYDDVNLFGSTSYGDYQCSNSLTLSDQYCTVTPSGSSVWIMMDGASNSTGAVYTLNSVIALQGENLHLDYNAGGFPYGGMTNEVSSLYYIDGLVPYQYYDITLTNLSDDLDLVVSSSYSSYSSYSPCNEATGTSAEACGYTTGSGGAMVIQVFGDKTLYGGTFTLGVTSGLENQGSSTIPVLLDQATALNYNGEVSYGASYYKINGLIANTFYAVSLTNLTDLAGLSLYEISDYTTSACDSNFTGTAAEWCGATSNASGELFVKVDGYSTTGTAFTLGVDLAPVSEGEKSLEIWKAYGTADLPYNGSVDLTYSYYGISGLDGATSYSIVLTNVTSRVTVRAFTSPSYDYSGNECNATGVAGDTITCTLTTTNGGAGGSELYIEVDGRSSKGGATYTLNVTP